MDDLLTTIRYISFIIINAIFFRWFIEEMILIRDDY